MMNRGDCRSAQGFAQGQTNAGDERWNIGMEIRGEASSATGSNDRSAVPRGVTRARGPGVSRWGRTAFLLIGLSVAIPAGGDEKESSANFLDALRQKGYFDTALEYLETLDRGDKGNPDFQAELLLQRGNLLRDLARTQLLPSEYEATQQQAREFYEKFLSQFPDHDRYPEGAGEIAQLRQQQIRGLLLRIRRAGQGDGRSTLVREFQQTAREIQEESSQRERVLRERLEKFPKFIDADESPDLFTSRRRTEVGLITLRLQAAILTFDEGEVSSLEDRKRLTQSAFEEFEKLYKEYRTNLAGLYARLYQGRCYQRLGKTREAQGVFKELMLIRTEDPQGQSIVDDAHLAWLQALLEEGSDKQSGEEKLGDLIQDADTWIKTRPDLVRSRTGQGVRWVMAQAYEKLGESHSDSEEIREGHYERAVAVAQILSQQPGEYQQPASSMALRLSQKLGRDLAAAKDFSAAFFECLNRIRELELLQESIEQEEGENERRQIQGDMELKRPATNAQLQQTLGLVRGETPPEEVARVRYWLSYLYFLSARYQEAAVIGEYIGRRFADNPQFRSVALESSFMAILAYSQAYQRSAAGSREFEAERMASLCDFIEKKWPGESKTDEAILTTGRVLADQSRPDLAALRFEKIGEQSKFRLEGQLGAATAYWNAYLRESSKPSPGTGTSGSDSLGEVAGYPEIALKKLQDSIREADKDLTPGRPQSGSLLLARLTLAQIENHRGDYQAAREVLLTNADSLIPQLKNHAPEKTPRSGPHSLPFQIEAHRQWLRAAIGLQNLEDALQALDALGKLEGGGGKAADLYIAVGEQFSTELTQWRDRDARKFHEILSSFEGFLTQLSARPESRTPRILLWIGESWLNLADNQGQASTSLPYLERSIAAFDEVLKFPPEELSVIPPELLTATHFRRASALRRSGKFEEAYSELKSLLSQKPNAIDLQMEGARLMKDWVRLDGPQSEQRWSVALQGEEKTSTSRFWGWGEIASRFQRELERDPQSEKMLNLYVEARHEIAECRYLSALSSVLSAERKAQMLTRAAADVQYTAASTPLPDSWKPKFERLWGDIHSALGLPTPALPGTGDGDGRPLAGSPEAIPRNPSTSSTPPVPGRPENPFLSGNLPIILFGVVAGLILLVTVYLNRPRKRASRRLIRSSPPRNF